MQSAPAERTAFVAGLRAELSGFRELHQILLAEQDCLLRADAQALPELIEIKSRQIERLHALAGQRSGYLTAHRLDPSRAWHAGVAREPGRRGPDGADGALAVRSSTRRLRLAPSTAATAA